jgi:heme A synthase
VSAGARYLAAMAVVSVAALAIGAVLPGAWRPGWWLALGLTLVVQGPLGWWLVVSIGTERFLAVWVLGILTRLALVALVGLVVIPAFGWPAAPALLALVGLLVVSLALEGIVSALQHSRALVR